MSADNIKETSVRFARRCVDVYIKGALRLCDKLAIQKFCIIAPGKDLNGAVDKSIDGWRYKVLPDGTIYIGSLAMQELVVSEGIKSSMPWLHNICNPRLEVSLVGGRVMADVGRSLLLRAGDVESNPGPIVAMLVLVIVAGAYHGAFRKFGGATTVVFESMFGGMLDEHIMDCMVIQSNHEWLRWAYTTRGVAFLTRTFGPMFGVPRYSEAGPSLYCRMLMHLRTPPIEDSHIFSSALFLVYCWVFWCCVCCAVVTTVAIFTGCSLRGMIHRRLRVKNNQKPFDVNSLKDSFRKYVDETVSPARKAGSHVILAFERRATESWCFNMLLSKFRRVRDVGGSRSRWPELAHAKHVCGPILDNADILRSEKDRGIFENCNVRGEDCPMRESINAAVLSHVDYHLSLVQLCKVVTGPTFVINHNFDKHRHGVGGSPDDFEAKVSISGGLVSMTPDGGTPYIKHPYYHWQSEGSVVTKAGAFVYVKLGELGHTSVYYCHPSDGVYNQDDLGNLHISDVESIPPFSKSVNIGLSDDKTCYEMTYANSMVKSIPASIVVEVAYAMASAPRDKKYADTLRSMLIGKLRAQSIDLNILPEAYHLVAYQSDKLAVDIIPWATNIVGNPLDFSYFDIIKNKIRLLLSSWVNYSWCRQFVGNCAAKFVPWSFPEIKVPTYEVYVDNTVATFGTGLRTKFNNSKFRAEASPANASSTKQSVASAGQNNGQCAGISSNTGTQCSTSTASVVHGSNIQAVNTIGFNAAVTGSGYPSPSTTVANNGPITTPVVQASNGTEDGGLKNEASGVSTTISESEAFAIKSDVNKTRPIAASKGKSSTSVPYTVAYTNYAENFANFVITTPTEGIINSTLTSRDGASFISLQNEDELESFCMFVERILNEGATELTFGQAKDVTKWLFRYYSRPCGYASDKSNVPAYSRVYPIVESEAANLPDGHKAHFFYGVGIALSPLSTGTIPKSCGKKCDKRGREKGSSR